ncbi:MAG: 50S ribosomal protein L20, partial [Phaeodactylibacter sp.]|nr:50S ribosomal protein L20 [Phaeodactylibacter sp.]
MPRSVNSVASRKRRKKILKMSKGFFGARGNVYTVAKNTVEKGLQYAYRDRKAKKGAFRRLWIAGINAAARMNGVTYSRLIHQLTEKDIQLDRK